MRKLFSPAIRGIVLFLCLNVAWGANLAVVGAFPHIASGGGWSTVLGIMNPSSSIANIQINFYDDNGFALVLPLSNADTNATIGSMSSYSMMAQPNGMAYFQISGSATLTGWAQVLSDQPTVGGMAFFNLNGSVLGGSEQQGIVTMETRSASGFMVPLIQPPGELTAVAMANRTSQQQTVTVTVRAPDGTWVGSKLYTLAPLGHMAFVVSSSELGFTLTSGTASMEFSTPSSGVLTVLGLTMNSRDGSFGINPTIVTN
jgi:hypothetical protein